MSQTATHTTNESKAAEAFSKQAPLFDALYSVNPIIQYKRERVRAHTEKLLPANASILELNAGTGDDAIYFAQKGHSVHATDISTGMQQQLQQKAKQARVPGAITTELCSFTQLEQLQNKGPYDLIFSNFAGLNCTGELDKVLQSFAPLLKPNGAVVLVILPPFCLWEALLAFRGKFKNAFRRFNSRKGITAYVEGVPFTCWYYKPSYIIRYTRDLFNILGLEGLCSIVPPSYFENFPARHPKAYAKLVALENKYKGSAPFKHWGDYFIISLRKK